MSAAEDKSENESSQVESSSSEGGGGNKLVLILSLVNVVATLAMVGILFVSLQREKKAPIVEDIAVQGAHGEGEAEAKKEGEGHGAPSAGAHGAPVVEKKKTSEFGKMLSLELFTVNLSTPGSVTPKYVRVNVSIELPNEEVEGEVTSKMAQVRNVIIDLFNSKRPADLSTAEGRDYIKEEIRSALNAFLVTGKVKGVFFTSFSVTT